MVYNFQMERLMAPDILRMWSRIINTRCGQQKHWMGIPSGVQVISAALIQST